MSAEQILCWLEQILYWLFTPSLTDYISSFATAALAILAWKGYNNWKKQILEKSKHDIAKEIMLASLKVRDSLIRIRNPGRYPEDFSSEISQETPTDDWWLKSDPDERERLMRIRQAHYDLLTQLEVFKNRFNRAEKLAKNLQEKAREGESILGDISVHIPDQLFKTLSQLFELWLNKREELIRKTERYSLDDNESDPAYIEYENPFKKPEVKWSFEKNHNAVYKDEDDDFDRELKDIISDIQIKLNKHLSLDIDRKLK